MSSEAMAIKTSQEPFLNLTEPNLTRIFDYLAGGVTNFAVDRQVADQLLARYPFLQTMVRLGKAVTQEATKQLYQEGFEQFLDLGSSIPSEIGIHTFAPRANVIYTDIDPVAVSYGNSLFSSLENVHYAQCDVQEIHYYFEEEPLKDLIDWKNKVAVGLNFLALFLPPAALQKMVSMLSKTLPKRSKIFQILYTKQDEKVDSAHDAFLSLLRSYRFSVHIEPMEAVVSQMLPWRPSLLQPASQYLGLQNVLEPFQHHQISVQCSAAIFELP